MNFWWVNQGNRFNNETELEILWNPTRTANGNYTELSQKIVRVREGDFVFHYHDYQIKIISSVVSVEYSKLRPDTEAHSRKFKQEKEGVLVHLEQKIIPPIPIYELPKKFFWGYEQYGRSDNIFTEKEKVRTVYCLCLSPAIVSFLYKTFTSVKSIIPETIMLEECPEEPEELPDSPVKLVNNEEKYTLADLQNELFIIPLFSKKLETSLRRKKQICIYGSPGTGKTHLAKKLARTLISESDGYIEVIQFHSAYTYEDFIQGLRPITDKEGNLRYEIVLGRFLKFCEKARGRSGSCVLIIDEINRANLSAVFGELMYLLEYRNQEIKLAGSNESFSIPENVYIIGTMNTADRSIALVDHALRRRFAFIELHPDYNILRKWHEREETDFDVEPLIVQIEKVNEAIADRHYHLGISFFLDSDLTENIADIWELEIYPYLEELFYSEPEKLEKFTWNNIKQSVLGDAET